MGGWWTLAAVIALAAVAFAGWQLAHPQGGAREASGTASAPAATSTGAPTTNGSVSAASAFPTVQGEGPPPSAGTHPARPGSTQGAGRTDQAAAPAAGEQADGDHADAQPGGDRPGEPPASGLPGVSHPRATSTPLRTPLPKAAAARGRIVAGYPSQILPTPSWAHVRSSSVSTAGSTLQAAMQAGAGRGQAVLEHYREALIRQGFGVTPTPVLGVKQALVFSRRHDSVVVTVDRRHSSFSLFAVLHAASRR